MTSDVNRDNSTESRTNAFLFTNCDIAKKRTSEFFNASRRDVSISYILRFFLTDRHISKMTSYLNSRANFIINTTKSATWRDIQSLLTTIYSIFLLVFKLICQRSDFTFKRETKIIHIFKLQFINGIANLQMFAILKFKTCKENGTPSVLQTCVFSYKLNR